MRNDQLPSTTLLKQDNIKLLIQKSVQRFRMSFTPAKESFGDKESTLFIKGIHQYLQNVYGYVLGEGEHTEMTNYKMEKM
jgi:hypothetical protein